LFFHYIILQLYKTKIDNNYLQNRFFSVKSFLYGYFSKDVVAYIRDDFQSGTCKSLFTIFVKQLPVFVHHSVNFIPEDLVPVEEIVKMKNYRTGFHQPLSRNELHVSLPFLLHFFVLHRTTQTEIFCEQILHNKDTDKLHLLIVAVLFPTPWTGSNNTLPSNMYSPSKINSGTIPENSKIFLSKSTLESFILRPFVLDLA
jgi:hypothetical protein